MRKTSIERNTNETKISLELCLDGGECNISTGVGFLDHMLDLFAKHGNFGLKIKADGDCHIDYHHTVEDIGIVLGKAFREAVGDKVGINRYGFFLLPMDETLAETAIDFSGRTFLVFNANFPTEKIGDFDCELVDEFFRAFTNNAQINLHINVKYGNNSHHIAEAIYKSVARSLKMSLEITSDKLMSTKGVLE